MNLNLLFTFYTVVMNNSFSVAAEKLCVTNSVISKHIKQLEQELSCSLIQRTTRKINLTEEGQFVYDRCTLIFDNIEQCYSFINERQNLVTGKLRIKIAAALEYDDFVIDKLEYFSSVNPELELDIIIDNQIGDLIGEQVDLVLKIGPLEDSSYKSRKIKDIDIYIVASPSYLAKYGTPEKPQDLLEHKCMRYAYGLTDGKWAFIGNNQQMKIDIVPILQSDSESLLAKYALKGMGITTTLDFIAEPYIQSGELRHFLRDYTTKLDLTVIYPNNAVIPFKTRKLIDLFINT